MATGRLIRFFSDDHGTLGTLVLDSQHVLNILEPEEKDNETNVSCIPAGRTYKVVWHNSPKYGWCYKVTGVYGRSDILFHEGNIEDNSKGCLLPGTGWGKLNGKKSVTNSRNARRILEKFYGKKEWYLTIAEAY